MRDVISVAVERTRRKMEENPQDVEAEVPQQEVVPPQEELKTENSSPENEVEQANDKEKNFARLRASKEQLEKENHELRSAIQQQTSPAPVAEEDELGIDDDDIVEGKVVRKLYNELRSLKSSYEKERASSIPDKLKSKFKDFDQVVTAENVEKLKHSEPELYATVTSGSDLYAKGVSAYKTLKALGIVKEDIYTSQKDQAHSNHGKPLSAQAIKGQGALSEANIFAKGLTPELKSQLQKEMTEAAKAR